MVIRSARDAEELFDGFRLTLASARRPIFPVGAYCFQASCHAPARKPGNFSGSWKFSALVMIANRPDMSLLNFPDKAISIDCATGKGKSQWRSRWILPY